MQLQDVRVLGEGLGFPEGPVALGDGSIALVEIQRGRVSRVGGDGSVSVVAEVGGAPTGLARGPNGALYVCNAGRGDATASIQRVDVESGHIDVLYDACEGQRLSGPNDLVFDHDGGFWFTDSRANAIYYARADGSAIVCAVSGALTPNGIGLSPDARVLYWAQTHTRQIIRRHVERPGELRPSPGCDIGALVRSGSIDRDSLLVGLPGAQELDGFAVEESGSVCVATLVESGITVISPDGSSVEKFTLPDELADGAVTNVCFGGSDLRTAFITLSMTGRLVSSGWPRPGLRLAYQE